MTTVVRVWNVWQRGYCTLPVARTGAQLWHAIHTGMGFSNHFQVPVPEDNAQAFRHIRKLDFIDVPRRGVGVTVFLNCFWSWNSTLHTHLYTVRAPSFDHLKYLGPFLLSPHQILSLHIRTHIAHL
jgi:hypothetical protein